MELTDTDLEAVCAGKGLPTPQLLGRMTSARPFRPLLGWDWWRAHAVAK